MTDEETPLSGGTQTLVTRAGDVVYRSSRAHSRTVIALLRHLHDVGFVAAPEPIGDGFAPDGREQLRYIEGSSPQPHAWSDGAVHDVGRLLRDLHRATAGFVPPAPARWRPRFVRELPGSRPVIGHGDLGPWNILARDGRPVAFIDWDNAGPIDALWDLAEAAWLNAQLHDDDVAARNDLPPVEARARQLRLLVDGYGLERADRVGFVDRLIELAIRCAREEAVELHVGPDTPSPAPDGFPILWAVTWRARAAAWMLDHRSTLERALDA